METPITSEADNTVAEYSFFTEAELMCPCCKACNMQPDLMAKLNLARDIAGKPWHVNSAYRCSKHNAEVKGTTKSSHLKGWAVDIAAKTSAKKYEIISAALKAGFNRIGIGSTYIHLDCDPKKATNVIWTY